MPYNPGGVFTLIASYFAQPGTTIRTEQHNPPLEDIGSALSSVVLRDGRAPMTGPLNMNGFAINNIVAGNSPGSVATLAQAMPIGAVIDFVGSSAPAGWALGYGQAISRTAYPALFALIGTTYGAGDGSTTFNLPDLRGRVVAGLDTMGGASAGRLDPTITSGILGSAGGLQSHTLTTSQIPNHNHNLHDPGHKHQYVLWSSFSTTAGNAGGINALNTQALADTTPSGTGITIDAVGGGAAHNNVQPTIVLNKIIRISYDG